MLSGSIEYTLPPNLWYTIDGRPLHGEEVGPYRSLVKNTAVNFKAFQLTSSDLIIRVVSI